MSKKRLVLISGIIVVFVVAIITYFLYIPPNAKKIPQVLSETLTANGSFEFSCMLETNGESREYFWLSGEKSKTARHLSGRVLGTEVELYYVDGNIFQYDNASNIWLSHRVEDIGRVVELYAEFEPSAAFVYDSLQSIEYIGRNSDGEFGYKYHVIPKPIGWINDFFTDVEYVICLDRFGQLVYAEIIANLKDAEDTTMRAFVLYEVDDDMQIDTPKKLEQ